MFDLRRDLLIDAAVIEYPCIRMTVSRYIYINGDKCFISGFGKATCMPEDKFNEEFGKELAKTKAIVNYFKKEEKLLIKLTKQPEWRKEKPKEEYIVGPCGNKHRPDKFVSVNMFNNTTDKTFKFTVEEL